MKIFSLHNTPLSSISHDPPLKKKILVPPGNMGPVQHLSHIIMPNGSQASEHSHAEREVMYLIKGRVEFKVSGKDTILEAGQCMIVEPGELHSVSDTSGDAELIYFKVEYSPYNVQPQSAK